MPESAKTADLEKRLSSLEREFDTYAASHRAVFDDVQELFNELAKALDVMSASLEDLTPLDVSETEETGIMGRAFELQALVGMFRKNLDDLTGRLTAIKKRRGKN